MKEFFIAAILVTLSAEVQGQCNFTTCGDNLVPNPGFDIVAEPDCSNPDVFSQLWTDSSPVEDWVGGLTTTSAWSYFTPDYFNPDCAANNPAEGLNGSSAVGFFSVVLPGDGASEWFQGQLFEPLVAGQQYCISFFAKSYTEIAAAGDGLDVLLLNNQLDQEPAADGLNPDDFIPAYSNPQGDILPEDFIEISFSYCAEGGEQWIAFGNQNADETTTEPPSNQSYVIIDNVSVFASCNEPPTTSLNLSADQTTLGCDQCTNLEAFGDDGQALNVSWSTGMGNNASTIEVCPNITTTYTATYITESCGANPTELTEEITITVDCEDEVEEINIVLNDEEICEGNSISLNAIVTGGVPPYSFSWSPGIIGNSNPITVSPGSTTNYTVTVTDAEGNQADATAQVAVADAEAFIDLGPDTTFCSDLSVQLDAELPFPATYLWNTGQSAPAITLRQTGTYFVTANTACGILSDTIRLTAFPSPLSQLVDRVTICENTSTTIGFSPSDDYNVIWSTGEFTPSIEVSRADNYTGAVRSECGVQPFEVRVFTAKCDCDIFIPTAFSPNSDGVNDVFKAVADCDFESFNLRIYNRWGQLMFESNDPETPWVGDIMGDSYNAGPTTYNYLLEATPVNPVFLAEPIVIRGSVTSIR